MKYKTLQKKLSVAKPSIPNETIKKCISKEHNKVFKKWVSFHCFSFFLIMKAVHVYCGNLEKKQKKRKKKIKITLILLHKGNCC
jgi:hypothetical protein